jgi:hypothetical protein
LRTQDEGILGNSIQKAVIFAVLAILLASPAIGRDFSVRRQVDGYSLDIAINRNPPIIGKNDVRIEIKDAAGKSVVNAAVTVNYSMPPMPGMPPMNYTVKAPSYGSGYGTTMDLIMTGPWNIAVKAILPGKQLRLTFPIDVR